MVFEKTPEDQTLRAIECAGDALEAVNNRMDVSAEYDVDRDRVIVVVDGEELAELGPTEWHHSDDEIRKRLQAAVINRFGHSASSE